MAVVYLGTSGFAAGVLERLAAEQRHRPALVVTRPDRKSGRGRHPRSPPVAESARRLGLALAQPDSVNEPDAAGRIIATAGEAPGPPTVIVCAFGALIGEGLLAAQRSSTCTPRCCRAGAAPLPWSGRSWPATSARA